MGSSFGCGPRAGVWCSRAAARRGGSRLAPEGSRAVAGERLRRCERLRRAADFRRVFRTGDRLGGALFNLVASYNALGRTRVGLAVGRKIGTAVARNRAKRL